MADLKNRVQYATSIDKELKDAMKVLSEKTRIPQSKLIDEAIKDLLKKHNIEMQSKSAE
ncbi:MAG: ribbon-helix-helix domain-containing protein [Tissierellia bacterium]|nr:ribbon-helix-helix domain-containing protein [Tissierellia bacterium]